MSSSLIQLSVISLIDCSLRSHRYHTYLLFFVSMTFKMCCDTMFLVLSSVFFRLAYSQNFLSLFYHHVSVIIFCDKLEHDLFKLEHDSFKFDKRQIKLLIDNSSRVIFTISLDTMRQIKLLIDARREYDSACVLI